MTERVKDRYWTEYANWLDFTDLRSLWRVGGGDLSLVPATTLRLVEACQLDVSGIREDCRREITRRHQWGTDTQSNTPDGLAPVWNGRRNLRIV